jgi:glycosyltransferase involved in cell wall biosynthesis
LESALGQDFSNFEILVKDGGSTDGSVDAIEHRYAPANAGDARVRIVRRQDTGIYDAMNQAVSEARGEYLLFMNCGDYFADEKVLGALDAAIREDGSSGPLRIYYGDRYARLTGSVEYSAPKITPLVCYRNIPCHQAICYSASCFERRGYDPKYKVRADYEHFLWCYFAGKAAFCHVPVTIASYEGGGYSETKQNAERSAREHAEITRRYMSPFQRFYCRAYLILTLQPLRHAIATNPRLSGFYNALVRRLYRKH